jgi:Domain of unknown function (DUF4349)
MDSRVNQGQRSLFASILLSSLLFGSCSAAPNPNTESLPSAPAASPAPAAPPVGSGQSLRQNAAMKEAASSPEPLWSNSASDMVASKTQQKALPPQKAQLIKTATLRLKVKDVEKVIPSTIKVVTGYGGDILSLQDQVPQQDTEHHTASFEFRVPQAQLEVALSDLSKIGTVEARSIQAEDVANQLVDFDARLKNLRKSEEVVLGIMARSGSVSDVLKVSQELSQIRNEIEQIQGQVQHLQQQVAYSRINLNLEEAIAQNQQSISVGDRLQETWSQSTHALGKTTTDLLRLGIWLLVFSPYLLGGAAFILLGRKILQRKTLSSASSSAETSVSSES